ncbi:diguanylate cyclase [Caloramator sp. E03]|uniref:NifB/NifX family molybdenum-iron cluster-binding protein n=1 Tax=Caloramator sp. E03 TaxID=2576307 RepID=UPI001110386B|nr:NifB/NifX family molybdenum-iron cluster-binding protein [Caloramator sp. E03]QCX34316.1 diguanylate cyclase [Caloramator sp. E03]
MKIAVSSEGKGLNSLLDVRFGRCNYFVIYDTEGEIAKAIENKGQMSGGGAGIAAAQQIIDEDVDVVITGNLGPNAFNLLKNSDIKVYRCGSINVERAIQLFNEGKLDELTQAGPAHAGMGIGAGRGFRGGR